MTIMQRWPDRWTGVRLVRIAWLLPAVVALITSSGITPSSTLATESESPFVSALDSVPEFDAAAPGCKNTACAVVGDRLACVSSPGTTCKLGQRRPAPGAECFQNTC